MERNRQPRLKDRVDAGRLLQWSPFLRPEWRYERVLTLVDGVDGPRRCRRHDDDWIRRYRGFLLKWRSLPLDQRDELVVEDPGIYHAQLLRNAATSDPDTLFILEARLLSGQRPDEIAFELHALTEAVEAYAALWFDVQPRLDRRDWIFRQVLLPAFERQRAQLQEGDDDADDDALFFAAPAVIKPFLDASLKYFAYFGGPLLCDFLLAGFRRGVRVSREDEIGSFLDDDFIATIRRRSAAAARAFDVDKMGVYELFNVHARLMEMQQRADTGEESRNYLERNLDEVLRDLPFVTGDEASRAYANTRVGDLDREAAELRADELLLAATGAAVPDMPGGFDDILLSNGGDDGDAQ